MFWTPSHLASDAETSSTCLDVLIEHSPIAILVLNAEHRFEMCNPAFEELFQYDRISLMEQNVVELITLPARLQEGMQLTNRVLAGHTVHTVTRRRRRDGEVIEVELHGVPLVVDGMVRGVYGLYQNITARSRAESAVRQLTRRLMHVQDEERRRIARDLHDTTAQELAALNMKLRRLESLVGKDDGRQRPLILPLIQESLQLATECSKKIRTTSYLLHPPLLEEAGLKPALLWLLEGFEERSGIEVKIRIDAELGRVCATMELALFRVVQESLSNVLRHSYSPDVAVDVASCAETVTVTISDHGRGIREDVMGKKQQRRGVGIAGMRERVEQLGGSLQVRSDAKGTCVCALFSRTSCVSEGLCPTCG